MFFASGGYSLNILGDIYNKPIRGARLHTPLKNFETTFALQYCDSSSCINIKRFKEKKIVYKAQLLFGMHYGTPIRAATWQFGVSKIKKNLATFFNYPTHGPEIFFTSTRNSFDNDYSSSCFHFASFLTCSSSFHFYFRFLLQLCSHDSKSYFYCFFTRMLNLA